MGNCKYIAKAIINKKPGTVVLIKLLRDCKVMEIDYQLLELELMKKCLYVKTTHNSPFLINTNIIRRSRWQGLNQI